MASAPRVKRKYPRVRGEERTVEMNGMMKAEIPPRARGRAVAGSARRARHGNTPACAGKRWGRWPVWLMIGKYPRVRGEERTVEMNGMMKAEIPPRARGRAGDHLEDPGRPGNTPACAGKRRPPALTDGKQSGNTPACAGKSARRGKIRALHRKYPRVRGEESFGVNCARSEPEIPPRARGRERVL